VANQELHAVIRHLYRVAGPEGRGALTDPELLDRWVAERDGAAFEVLLWRHGTMVLNVCRRLLTQEPDVEDAFQAAFFALARKAGSIGKRGAVGAWLYRVAYRTALAARARAAKRARREGPLVDLPAPAGEEVAAWRDLRPVLDEEVDRLPEKYRAPFVLCYLDGLTNEQAARQLGCPKGTVATRLAWARERLRERLTRRGLARCGAPLGALLSPNAAAAPPPPAWVVAALDAAPRFAAGAGAVSTGAAALAEGVLQAMSTTKFKMATVLLVVMGLLGAGAGALRYRAPAAPQPGAQQGPPPAPAARGPGKPKEDKAPLQGAWDVIAHDTLGRPASKEFLARKHQWVFAGAKLTLRDKDGVAREGTFRIDPEKKPKVLDVTFQGGLPAGARALVPAEEAQEGIYELEGDTLKVCYGYPGKGRPTEFASKADPPTGLVVFRREPPAKGPGREGAGKPTGAPLEVRLVVKQDTYTLDLGGKAPAEFTRHVREEEAKARAGRPAARPPAVPVGLVLELRNTGKKGLTLTLGGDASTLTLELQGPGALSAVAHGGFTEKPVPGTPVTIAPGEGLSLPVPSLSYGARGVQYRAYWARAGDYTLTARLMTTEFRGPFVSAPVKLKVRDKEEDRKIIQGTWVPAAAELGGKKLPGEGLKAMRLTLTGDKYTAQVGGQTDRGTIKLDPARKPKAMDVVGTEGPNKGKTTLAIYELTGDGLRICYDLSGKARPAEFKTKADTQLFLVTYKRGEAVKLRSAAKKAVEIEVTSARAFPPIGAVPVLHIGAQTSRVSRYPATGETTTLIFTMSAAEFARTKNGDRILVKYDPDSQGQWDFGKLDKGLMDKE
jgi:RNA polymerase sigma factor (sigma-70 family)